MCLFNGGDWGARVTRAGIQTRHNGLEVLHGNGAGNRDKAVCRAEDAG